MPKVYGRSKIRQRSYLVAEVACAARKLLPILEWIPAYRRKWLLPDVLAGVALWAVTVPEGMA